MNKQQALERLTALENEVAELRKIIEQPEKLTPEERFWEMLNGCEIRTDFKKFPNSVFFMKEGELWFWLGNGYLWCKYGIVWKVFEVEHGLNYAEIQSLIKSQVEQHFKMKNVTPVYSSTLPLREVEQHLKMKG